MERGPEHTPDGPPLQQPPEESTERPEASLPELELNELCRTEKPLTQYETGARGVEQIEPWHNYTMVTLEGGKRILIFDESMEPVQDFVAPLDSREITVVWGSGTTKEKIKKKSRKNGSYIGTSSQANSNSSIYDVTLDLPTELVPFGKKALNTTGAEKLYMGDLTTAFTLDNVVVASDKIVLLTEKGGAYGAFLTETDAGVELAPRNWIRIGPGDVLPQEVVDAAERQKGEYRGVVRLNDAYYAAVTDVGIHVFQEGKSDVVFSDRVPSIGKNIVLDPSDPNVLFYCQSSNPRTVMRLDLRGEPSTWSSTPAELPQHYDEVTNLQLDPSGNFFLFSTGAELVIMTKDTLQEVKRVPGMTRVNFDEQSRIRAVNKEGHLVLLETNFQDLRESLDRQRVARLAAGVDLRSLFDRTKQAQAREGGEALEHLRPLRERYDAEFQAVLAALSTDEGITQLRNGLELLRGELRQQGLQPNEVAFVTEGLDASVREKEKVFAGKAAAAALIKVHDVLGAGLSLATVSEARAALDAMVPVESLLDQASRGELHSAREDLEHQSADLFRQRGAEVIRDVSGLVARTRADVEGFTTKSQMDDWLEFRYPQLKARLGSLAREVPLEADEAYKAIIAARDDLETTAREFEEKFKLEYAKVREKAKERIDAAAEDLAFDIDGLIERLRAKAFGKRGDAEIYLEGSEAKHALEQEIAALALQHPDAARELDRALKVRLSNTLTEIERGALTSVAETGQQMVAFGTTLFPKWEARVQERERRDVRVVFQEDPKSHGPGVKAGDILGDVAFSLHTSHGTETVRLYEEMADESEWRLGLQTKAGKPVPPSYVSAQEFASVKRDYGAWDVQASPLRKEYEGKRGALKELYATREHVGSRTADDVQWQERYRAALEDYASFCADRHIPLLRRIDRVRAEPDIENGNGKGFVPEWQNHWVMDPQTERDLEAMARGLKMQLDLQEGLLNLKGHAGTGKDVRVKMFCSFTHRPYFAMDGTKWTTEYELSEDVVLEAEDGASQTVKVPSTVLSGITTPGAVVYFNEFNAMPEQAQIFLHALMDEKRSLTLKTSSGKTIRAHPSALLIGSMNPDYPGTFRPQFATRSRMVSLDIDYPPLTRDPDKGDTNTNRPYDASEALRMARGIDSLADLTYEASIERNAFVQMWDKYVNGIANGAPEPTVVQKFDVDTTLALVQFTEKLRADFIAQFEKTRAARKALPVNQPMTGRELRRCAYAMNEMTAAEKASANPEAVARALLERFFLTHIDKKEDVDAIRTAMGTWTSKKRVRA